MTRQELEQALLRELRRARRQLLLWRLVLFFCTAISAALIAHVLVTC